METETCLFERKIEDRLGVTRARRVASDQLLLENQLRIQAHSLNKRRAQDSFYNSNRRHLQLQRNSIVPVKARLGVKQQRRSQFMYPTYKNVMYRRLKPNRPRQNQAQRRLQNLRRYLSENVSNGGIKLVRNPINYTLQVNNAGGWNTYPKVHSCLAELDQQLQEEIRIIQMDSEHPPEVAPDDRVMVHCTDIELHKRFSK